MRKVDVMIARFPGQNSEHPDSSNWVMDALMQLRADNRIGKIHRWHKADTPIDMVRNLCVADAQDLNVDILYMIDSDMTPDTAGGKSFLDVSMDFLYGRLAPAVIGAPYVGGGPHHNVFVFQWKNDNNGPNPSFRLAAYEREEASRMKGIGEVAALPTGMIAYDMRVFDRLKQSDPGYFYYEMNTNRTEKESTEDVTNTRDISLAWHDVPDAGCFCAWDCWASHNKVVACEKPKATSPRSVGEALYHAWMRSQSEHSEALVEIGEGGAPEAIRDGNYTENGSVVASGESKIRETAKAVLEKFSDISSGNREEI